MISQHFITIFSSTWFKNIFHINYTAISTFPNNIIYLPTLFFNIVHYVLIFIYIVKNVSYSLFNLFERVVNTDEEALCAKFHLKIKTCFQDSEILT